MAEVREQQRIAASERAHSGDDEAEFGDDDATLIAKRHRGPKQSRLPFTAEPLSPPPTRRRGGYTDAIVL